MRVEPSPAESFGCLDIRDYRGQPVWTAGPPITPNPCTKVLPAGNYTVSVAFRPPQPVCKDFSRIRTINPLPGQLQLVARCS